MKLPVHPKREIEWLSFWRKNTEYWLVHNVSYAWTVQIDFNYVPSGMQKIVVRTFSCKGQLVISLWLRIQKIWCEKISSHSILIILKMLRILNYSLDEFIALSFLFNFNLLFPWFVSVMSALWLVGNHITYNNT